jgi:hypothetical protein
MQIGIHPERIRNAKEWADNFEGRKRLTLLKRNLLPLDQEKIISLIGGCSFNHHHLDCPNSRSTNRYDFRPGPSSARAAMAFPDMFKSIITSALIH